MEGLVLPRLDDLDASSDESHGIKHAPPLQEAKLGSPDQGTKGLLKPLASESACSSRGGGGLPSSRYPPPPPVPTAWETWPHRSN
eukprot:7048181-Alexandrium_andersonii.AAC.1